MSPRQTQHSPISEIRSLGVTLTLTPIHYETEPPSGRPILYFAGPTYVGPDVEHWHNTALKYLDHAGFGGSVCLPTPVDGQWRDSDALAQMDWQHRNLADATVIVFWVPRAGLVTCAEFGEWYKSGKVVLGIPPNTEKTDYLRYCAEKANVPQAISLNETLDLAMGLIN